MPGPHEDVEKGNARLRNENHLLREEREAGRFYQRDIRVVWRWPFAGSDRIEDFAVRDDSGSMLSGPVSGSSRYAMAAFSRQISRLML